MSRPVMVLGTGRTSRCRRRAIPRRCHALSRMPCRRSSSRRRSPVAPRCGSHMRRLVRYPAECPTPNRRFNTPALHPQVRRRLDSPVPSRTRSGQITVRARRTRSRGCHVRTTRQSPTATLARANSSRIRRTPGVQLGRRTFRHHGREQARRGTIRTAKTHRLQVSNTSKAHPVGMPCRPVSQRR